MMKNFCSSVYDGRGSREGDLGVEFCVESWSEVSRSSSTAAGDDSDWMGGDIEDRNRGVVMSGPLLDIAGCLASPLVNLELVSPLRLSIRDAIDITEGSRRSPPGAAIPHPKRSISAPVCSM